MLGMDWLRRFYFWLVEYLFPMRNYVTLKGLRFKLSYSDYPFLAIKVFAVLRMPNTPVLCAETVVCLPNTGMFVSDIVANEASTAVAMVTGLTTNILIPRSLVELTGDQIRIWIVNDRHMPVTAREVHCTCRID